MEDNNANGDFEIVEKIPAEPPNSVSLLTNIPPPSELPSFITAQTVPPVVGPQSSPPPVSQVASVSQPSHTPIQPVTIEPNDGKPQPIPANPTPTVPVTIQPLPPTSSSSSEPPGTSSPPTAQKDSLEGSASPPGEGWMGWIKGTVQSVGHKVAEKAKTSMDTMITTLDPQMRELINSGGDVDIIVASEKEVKVSPVKEAFQKTFGKATVTGFPSQCSSVAAQPVGYSSAEKSAEERIQNLRKSGMIHPEHPVVAVESFIVELKENYWVEMGLLMLDDPWFKITVSAYTQPIPLPDNFIQELRNSTPDDYPFKASGFQKTVGQVAAIHLMVHHSMWQETLTGIPRRDYILMAAKVLAELYRARLPSDVI